MTQELLRESPTDQDYDKCIRCGKPTAFAKETRVESRYGYIDGAGQLCFVCNQTRKMHKQGAYEV